MTANGIRPVRTRKHKVTTNSNHHLGIAANWLDGDFAADAPNQKWAGGSEAERRRSRRTHQLCLDRRGLALPSRHS
jgi:hypothetical protein